MEVAPGWKHAVSIVERFGRVGQPRNRIASLLDYSIAVSWILSILAMRHGSSHARVTCNARSHSC